MGEWRGVAPDFTHASIPSTALAVFLVRLGLPDHPEPRQNALFAQMIILVIRPGRIKRHGGQYRCHDRSRQQRVRCLFRGFGNQALRLSARENRGSVTVAPVTKLPPRIQRIDRSPKNVDERAIGNDIGVKADPHRLVMSGATPADLFVGRVPERASRETRCGFNDPVNLVEIRFDAPKTSTGQNGRLDVTRRRTGKLQDQSDENGNQQDDWFVT